MFALLSTLFLTKKEHMNFTKKEFLKISLKNVKPTIFKRYGNKCKSYLLISDKNGERWICEFEKGFKLDTHNHEGNYEWFVLSGKFRFTNPISLKSVILEKDDYYFNPKGLYHNEECLEDGKILWIYDKKND